MIKKILITILFLLNSSYVFATDKVIVQQRTVEFNADTYLGLQGYYSHGANLLKQKQAQEANTIKALEEQNKILKDLLNAILNKGNQLPVIPKVEEPEQKPEEKITPEQQLEDKVLKIFNDNCKRCHGDTKQDGGLTLVKDEKLVDLNLNQVVLSYYRVNGVDLDGNARMPKGSPALSDEDVSTMYKWLIFKASK